MQATNLMVSSILRGLAMAGQYVLPLICIAGAAVSAVRRRRRQGLVDAVTTSTSLDALNQMSWQEFELLVGEGFRRKGYSVSEVGGGGADGGVDLVLGKNGEKFLVQCKQWKAFNVGVTVVRELYGVMAAQGAAGGFVVTSGRFTQEAKAFAQGRNIEVVTGAALMDLLRRSEMQKRGPEQLRSESAKPAIDLAPSNAAPTCPACGKAMQRRVAKRGPSAGSAFWGCAGYPSCKSTLPF